LLEALAEPHRRTILTLVAGTATQVFYHDTAHPSALLLPIAPDTN